MIRAIDLMIKVNDVMSRKCKNYTSTLIKLARVDNNIVIVTSRQDHADDIKRVDKVNAISINSEIRGKSGIYILDNSVIEDMTTSFRSEIEENLKLINGLKNKIVSNEEEHNKVVNNLSKLISEQCDTISKLQSDNKDLKRQLVNKEELLTKINKIPFMSFISLKLLTLLKNKNQSSFNEEIISKL